jgi:ring-1,2-phenylacetyl-CoA epoxidase subunit PaaD
MIQQQIRLELEEAFEIPVEVQLVLDPPWTTDWISETGKEKLREFGIAPPVRRIHADHWRAPSSTVSCPHCGSPATEAVSEFGSTPCKALYRCTVCLEPFDYFKCH